MGIKEALDLALGIAERLRDLDLKRAILDVQEELQRQREQNLDLRQENHVLRTRVTELESTARRESELTLIEGMYWRVRDSERDGPFCHKCHDRDGKLVRLPPPADYAHSGNGHICRVCEEFHATGS